MGESRATVLGSLGGHEDDFMKEINNSLTNSLRLGPWRWARETPRIARMKARREFPGRLCGGARGRRIVVTFDEVGQTGRRK